MAKFTGKGATISVKGGGATPAYAAVGQVAEIGNIDVSADEVEVTTLDAGDYRDYLQGFKDPGTCQLKVIFDPALADQDDDPDGLFGLFTSRRNARLGNTVQFIGSGRRRVVRFVQGLYQRLVVSAR